MIPCRNVIFLKDINECANSNNACNQICINTVGSYYCDCNAGYHLISNQRYCIDTNECSTNNGGCQQRCNNTDGSYYCSCKDGYYWNTTDSICHGINSLYCLFVFTFTFVTDKDECSLSWSNNCDQNCHNTNGSYDCSCRTGYILDSDNSSCLNINECENNNGGCEQHCEDTTGSYYCECNVTGYALGGDNYGCSR